MMRDSGGFSLVELIVVVTVIGILLTMAIPNYQGMQSHAKEADVMRMAHTVQISAELVASMNDGHYSDLAADIMPTLAQGALLRNPFTGNATEPQFSAAATTPGQVGLQVTQQGGIGVSYTITGFGKEAEVIRYNGGSQ